MRSSHIVIMYLLFLKTSFLVGERQEKKFEPDVNSPATLLGDPAPPLKVYTLNLDLPEHERWVPIVKNYAKYTPDITKAVSQMVSPKIFNLATTISQWIIKYLPQNYAREIDGVAEGMNMTLGEAVLLNIWYDVSTYCTSIIVEDENENIYHGRNLDYDFKEILGNLSFTVEFKRKGRVVYTGTTFAGLVGLFTGQKPNVFTISQNTRTTGKWWLNLIEAIFDKKAGIGSFRIRDQLEEAKSFDQAVRNLTETHLIAPQYFIIGGVSHGQGAVVSHGRSYTPDVWFLNETKSGWYLVETNYDHWKEPPAHDDRRHPAIKALEAIGIAKITPETLYQALSTKPVLNEDTTYTTIMAAKYPELYKSRRR